MAKRISFHPQGKLYLTFRLPGDFWDVLNSDIALFDLSGNVLYDMRALEG